MNSRRTLAAVLALTQLTTVLAAGVFSWNGGASPEIVPSASAEGFAGEDLGQTGQHGAGGGFELGGAGALHDGLPP